MCKVLEDIYHEAMERGRLNALAESVCCLKEKLGFTDQQAKDILNISDDDWERIAVRL